MLLIAAILAPLCVHILQARPAERSAKRLVIGFSRASSVAIRPIRGVVASRNLHKDTHTDMHAYMHAC